MGSTLKELMFSEEQQYVNTGEHTHIYTLQTCTQMYVSVTTQKN